MHLTEFDHDLSYGRYGNAASFAMDILIQFGNALGAERMLDITRAHIDGCLYHGEVSLDFIARLVGDGGRVRVPTTLNVGSMDLIHPELIRSSSEERAAGRRLMEAHLQLGCES